MLVHWFAIKNLEKSISVCCKSSKRPRPRDKCVFACCGKRGFKLPLRSEPAHNCQSLRRFVVKQMDECRRGRAILKFSPSDYRGGSADSGCSHSSTNHAIEAVALECVNPS
jgi:hypothetical protein